MGTRNGKLFGGTRSAVLALLYGRPDERFHVREIIRRTGIRQGAVQRELVQLAAMGILRREQLGRQVFYSADPASPIFGELRGLVQKTVAVHPPIAGALQPLAERIRFALVFGSAARGELTQRSDVDLLVVGDVSFPEVVSALRAAEAQIGREINPYVMDAAEFHRRVSEHFLAGVMRGPVLFIMGDRNEPRELGGSRVAEATPEQPAGDRRSAGGSRPRPQRRPG